jgi:hypothetical protein
MQPEAHEHDVDSRSQVDSITNHGPPHSSTSDVVCNPRGRTGELRM